MLCYHLHQERMGKWTLWQWVQLKNNHHQCNWYWKSFKWNCINSILKLLWFFILTNRMKYFIASSEAKSMEMDNNVVRPECHCCKSHNINLPTTKLPTTPDQLWVLAKKHRANNHRNWSTFVLTANSLGVINSVGDPGKNGIIGVFGDSTQEEKLRPYINWIDVWKSFHIFWVEFIFSMISIWFFGWHWKANLVFADLFLLVCCQKLLHKEYEICICCWKAKIF